MPSRKPAARETSARKTAGPKATALKKAGRAPAKAGGSTKSRKKPPRPRQPGRPGGDGPDLRERLLDAALAVFARDGIGGASLRQIAAEAAVTPALLHYYFGDRQQLIDAVVAERILPVLTELRDAVLGPGDPAALVGGFVREMAALVERHPWWPPLWVREVLCEGGALRELFVRSMGPRLPVVMAGRFAEAQAQGRLDPALDPRLLVISLIGLTLFPAAGAPIWRRIFEADDIDAGTLRDHTIALLERGLGLPEE